MPPVTIFRKRRVLIILVVLTVLYFFVKYLPTDVPSVGDRIDSRTGRSQGRPFPVSHAPKQDGDTSASDTIGATQLYDGPVKFYHLAGSLRPHLYKKAHGRDNVLFMLHDLRGAASLTGLACEMALHNRTNVHMGLVAPHDVSIQEIMSIIGIKIEDCPIFWHDARPDYNSKSSPNRQAIVVKSAISHMHAALKPTVVMVDEEQASNGIFGGALQDKLRSIWTPLSVVPSDALTSMSWVAGLDGGGLSLLNQNQIDIIIQPYQHSAGSLIRLLESIKSAHYSGLPFPRITVELPQEIDPYALKYIENFRWPHDSPLSESKLILRRRIDDSKLSPAIASLRTVESFYPPTTSNSHVLVLSPDVELSPSYLQYLYLLTLTYKSGNPGKRITNSLMGISLDLPSHSLDNHTPFTVTTTPQIQPLLLHQTPSSTATLYFGHHWTDLQTYISYRLRSDLTLTKTLTSTPESSISPTHPAWLKLAQEIMQAQNTYILYPAFAKTPEKNLVTIHTESTQSPEEFWKDPRPITSESIKIPPLNANSSVLSADEPETPVHTVQAQAPHANMAHESTQSPFSLQSLLGLKHREQLPYDIDLPIYSVTGHLTDTDTSRSNSKAYADKLSLELGGCKDLDHRDDKSIGRVEYLFC